MTPVERLVRLVEGASGIVVREADHDRIRALCAARFASVGVPDLSEYVSLLERSPDHPEWRRLLASITVKESYLYRAPQHFRALVEVVLPTVLERRPDHRLQLWSAGCARGEEASSLAAVLAQEDDLAGWDWRVLATDVDEHALEDARAASYGGRAVQRVPEAVLERCFERHGGRYQLLPALRQRITYRAVNLVRHPLHLPEAPFDVVFLRNVLIYFRRESQRRVVEALARMLAPDGVLFLGPSESLWPVVEGLRPVDLGDCFCYRPDHGRPPRSASSPNPQRADTSPGSRTTAAQSSGARQRTTDGPVARPANSRPTPEPPRGDPSAARSDILEALGSNALDVALERVGDARRLLPDDPVLLLLEGLIHDVSAAPEAAVRSYRAALYLDPELGQARFLLARALQRLGREGRARREYRSLLATLGGGRGTWVSDGERVGLPSRAQVERACREALKRGRSGSGDGTSAGD